MLRLLLLALTGTLCACASSPSNTTHPALVRIYAGIGTHIIALDEMLTTSRREAQAAADAQTIKVLKLHTDTALAQVWGLPSGITEHAGAANMHGWKTRWQTTCTDFDPAFAERLGNAPPEITRITDLGIVGPVSPTCFKARFFFTTGPVAGSSGPILVRAH